MNSKSMEELIKGYQDNLIAMQNVDGILSNVMPYLGKIGAEKEWNDNPEEAYTKFLHTKSYHDFINEDSLILLGRTGTGKTSILRCVCENVNRRKITDYDFAVIVPFNEILFNLVNTEDEFLISHIKSKLKESISMHINCYIMKTLIKKGVVDKTSKMYSYISKNDLYSVGEAEYFRSGINKFRNMVNASKQMNNKVGEIANNIVTIMDITEAFLQNGYEEAYNEMMKVLENYKILVLIDTLNEYDLRDVKIVKCVKALIATCFDYYNNSTRNHIYVKISIPSEIHTHIIEQLPGKQQGNTVVIQWKSKDLIQMIAIRLLYFSKTNQGKILNFENSYNYSDFYDENPNAYENAKKLIHEFLPEFCPTSLDFSLETLSYCIRHTLKKPRELMAIFNSFIYKIIEEKNFKFFVENVEKISSMIHSTQEDFIISALSMYTTSYPNILRACEIVLRNQRFYFKGKDLENRLKDAEKDREGYDKEDIKRILLESGLIGKLNKISSHYLPNDKGNADASKKEIRIMEAKFEYQVKGRLSLNRENYYVLHPMCYEHFECMLDSQTLVYPDALDSEVEWMKFVRVKKW